MSPRELARRTALRFIGIVDARPRIAAAVLLLACVLPAVLTVRFFGDLHSATTELLPRHSPSVKALQEIFARLGGQSRLIVIVQSPHREENERFVLELADRLKALHLPEARSIQAGCWDECGWAREHALLLMPKEKFDALMSGLDETIRQAKASANPLYVNLLDGDEGAQREGAEKRIADAVRANDRFPHGFFELPDGSRVLLQISLSALETEVEPDIRLWNAVKREVAAIRPKYSKDLIVAYNGEIPNIVEDHDAVEADLSVASLIVFFCVGGVILAFYRSFRGLLTVLLALLPGLLFTFAISRLWVRHLNSNTAFLSFIIAGNGINYPLMFLAAYRGRPLGEARAPAIFEAGRQVFRGTLAAAMAASAAYAGLAVSTFRGFSQFGVVGGVGMIVTWIFTYLTMPVAIAWINPPRGGLALSRVQRGLTRFFSHRTWPAVVAALLGAGAVFAGVMGVRFAARHGIYEMDMRVIRNRYSLTKGGASWDTRVNEVFGEWLNPVAVLVDDPKEREPAAGELRRVLVDSDGHLAERVETISSLVPPEPEQLRRLREIDRLARSLKNVPKSEIPATARPYLELWLAPQARRPIALEDVPVGLKQGFTEINGRSDRVIGVFPSSQVNFGDGRNLVRFEEETRKAKLPPDAVVGGSFLFMAEIIRVVRKEAPKVCLVVACLVALVLAPFFLRRPGRIPLVVGTVAAVAILAQATMLAFGVHVNMLNFTAIPITIGVGSDYVVNLLGVMESMKLDARRACARMGPAIFLCSLTTVIGYVSLLIAQSGALRTFGWAAVLGEIMAVTTVLLILPVILAPPIGSEHELPRLGSTEPTPAG